MFGKSVTVLVVLLALGFVSSIPVKTQDDVHVEEVVAGQKRIVRLAKSVEPKEEKPVVVTFSKLLPIEKSSASKTDEVIQIKWPETFQQPEAKSVKVGPIVGAKISVEKASSVNKNQQPIKVVFPNLMEKSSAEKASKIEGHKISVRSIPKSEDAEIIPGVISKMEVSVESVINVPCQPGYILVNGVCIKAYN